MAEALAVDYLGSDFVIESAGIYASSKLCASPEAVEVMARQGINLRKHLSRSLSEIERKKWNIIVAMTPQIAHAVSTLDSISSNHLVTWNVPDPYGFGIEEYEQCAENIKSLIPDLVPLLENETPIPFFR